MTVTRRLTVSVSTKPRESAAGSARRTLLQFGAGTAAAALLAACGASRPRPRAPSASDRDRGYRAVAARHLYARNPQRVYHGRMPPMLHAVGTLEVALAPDGTVRAIDWLRAPTHAPEVMDEVERMVHGASPFPAPGVSTRYIDTWLVDDNGMFQLETLTEGQKDDW